MVQQRGFPPDSPNRNWVFEGKGDIHTFVQYEEEIEKALDSIAGDADENMTSVFVLTKVDGDRRDATILVHGIRDAESIVDTITALASGINALRNQLVGNEEAYAAAQQMIADLLMVGFQ